MKFYRIKQVTEDRFLPQVKKGLVGSWNGIDAVLNEIWYSTEYQHRYCCVKTLEEARQRVLDYKLKIANKKKFPIYHKA